MAGVIQYVKGKLRSEIDGGEGDESRDVTRSADEGGRDRSEHTKRTERGQVPAINVLTIR